MNKEIVHNLIDLKIGDVIVINNIARAYCGIFLVTQITKHPINDICPYPSENWLLFCLYDHREPILKQWNVHFYNVASDSYVGKSACLIESVNLKTFKFN